MVRSLLRTWYGVLRKSVRAHRNLVNSLVAVAILVLGVAIGIASLIPDVSFLGAQSYPSTPGTLPARSFMNFSMPTNFGLGQLRLEQGNCSLFVYALDEVQFVGFNASGVLPAPVMDCGRRAVDTNGQIRWIVVQNRGDAATLFKIEARFFAIQSTRALLAFLALPFMLGGSTFIIMQVFRREVGKLARELDEQGVLDRRSEEERSERKR